LGEARGTKKGITSCLIQNAGEEKRGLLLEQVVARQGSRRIGEEREGGSYGMAVRKKNLIPIEGGKGYLLSL